MGWGRLISIEHHNNSFNSIPGILDKIEKSELCTVEVYTRGDEINSPKLVYESRKDNKVYPTARIALEGFRQLEGEITKTIAYTRIQRLKEQFINRNANEYEIKQIEDLEKLVNNKVIEEI